MDTKKSYRPNVAAVVLSSQYLGIVSFSRTTDRHQGAWQFPQGGIDQGETPLKALYRELLEEIGTDAIEVIAEYPKWITYDFPHDAQNSTPLMGKSRSIFSAAQKQFFDQHPNPFARV